MSTPHDSRQVFSNTSNGQPLSVAQMAKHALAITGNALKVVAGQLCMQSDDAISPVSKSEDLIAYIDRYAEVRWSKGGLAKAEFLAGLPHYCEKYGWSSESPHFPPIADVLYTKKRPKAANNGKLDELVDRFAPATPRDRELIKSFVLTLFWGGPAGKRPAFTFTSEEVKDGSRGRGAGKTTLVELLAGLCGGVISLQPRGNTDRNRTTLVTPTSWASRVVLIDNLKSFRFSSDDFESLVTCEKIGGHQLYRGYASRPNYLTFAVTVNGASFSKDLAQRTVVIQLGKPTRSPSWYSATKAFIEQYRDRIVADVRWHLEEKEPEKLGKVDRWADWCKGVLSRLDSPSGLLSLVEKRRRDIDADDQEEDDVIEHVRACLRARFDGEDPDQKVVRIPPLLMAMWIRMIRPDLNAAQASQYVKQLGQGVIKFDRDKHSRYFLFRGRKATDATPTCKLKYVTAFDPQ